MATSGTATWNLDIGQLVEEAYERAGLEMRGGYDLQTAIRSLNFLFTEWSNRGINLWTVEERTLAIVANDPTYTLPEDTIDILSHSIREGSGASQQDFPLERISFQMYSNKANKNSAGRPTSILVQRGTGAPTITLWQVPDRAYTLVYWRLRRIEDSGSTITNTLDVPSRYLEAMTAGLAYRIAVKKAPERAADLKSLYEEQMNLAETEDRDRSDIRFVPMVGR